MGRSANSDRVTCNGCTGWTLDCNGHLLEVEVDRGSDVTTVYKDGKEVLSLSTWEMEAVIRLSLASGYLVYKVDNDDEEGMQLAEDIKRSLVWKS